MKSWPIDLSDSLLIFYQTEVKIVYYGTTKKVFTESSGGEDERHSSFVQDEMI